jgi:hypothetical protein
VCFVHIGVISITFQWKCGVLRAKTTSHERACPECQIERSRVARLATRFFLSAHIVGVGCSSTVARWNSIGTSVRLMRDPAGFHASRVGPRATTKLRERRLQLRRSVRRLLPKRHRLALPESPPRLASHSVIPSMTIRDRHPCGRPCCADPSVRSTYTWTPRPFIQHTIYLSSAKHTYSEPCLLQSRTSRITR